MEILPNVTTWRELEGIILSEISQTKKGKYRMIFICEKKKKKKKHLNSETEKRLVVAKGGKREVQNG